MLDKVKEARKTGEVRRVAKEILESEELEGFLLVAKDNDGHCSTLYVTGPGGDPREYVTQAGEDVSLALQTSTEVESDG